jgi:phosphopantothenoylcysteine decarboxylase/phosphopantothenate--cysteine ligase
MARVLVGVTGGIAAYKACDLVRLLVRSGHEVIPLVTRGADRFVRRETFEALARRTPGESAYPHLVAADLLVIAPLTANTLARLAHGLADDLVTEAALAHDGPVLVAPAMNHRMWAHPATQANAELLRSRGVELIGPEEGELAEGETGLGRMSEPAAIHARCEELLREAGPQPGPSNSLLQGSRDGGSLAGRTVVVSAGGTREPLDSVRFLGNRSSGRMGVALAAEAARRGADVTLLAANLSVPAPVGVSVVETPTAADLEREALARGGAADVVVMAAAVADYRPAQAHEGKRPKSGEPWELTLERTVDVLKALGAARTNGQVLVGFAAEHGEAGIARAREKLRNKRADLVVYNDVSRSDIGFDAPDNEVVLIGPDGERRLDKARKERIAAAILDEVTRLLEANGRGR